MKDDNSGRRLNGVMPYFYKGLTAFFVIAAALVFYFILLRLGSIAEFFLRLIDILQPIIFGLVIAYLLNPVVNFFRRHLMSFFSKRMKKESTAASLAKGLSISLSMLLFVLIIFLLGYMVIPELISSITGLIRDLPNQIDYFLGWVNSVAESSSELLEIINSVMNYLKHWLQTDLMSTVNVLVGGFATGLMSIVSLVMNFVIGLIVAIYVLNSKERFARQSRKLLYALLRPRTVDLTLHMAKKSHRIFGGFINGKLIDSLIVGILCFIGLSILRMPYTLLVTVIVGVTNIIPVFGPYIGAVPSAILILLSDPVKGLIFIVFIILLQNLDGNVIGPRIIGESTGLSSFWVVFSILIGGGLFGIVGMMIGAPTFGVIYYIIKTLINYNLERKSLPVDTARYDGETPPWEEPPADPPSDGPSADALRPAEASSDGPSDP